MLVGTKTVTISRLRPGVSTSTSDVTKPKLTDETKGLKIAVVPQLHSKRDQELILAGGALNYASSKA